MQHQEKKFQVDSLKNIQKKLISLGATEVLSITSTHYYASQKGNDVIKLVCFPNNSEIHILKEASGRFKLIEKIPLKNKAVGFRWLLDKGFHAVDVVKMFNTDYRLKDGLIGLYTINDSLNSVILDYPESQYSELEQLLGLENSTEISVPYNKFLKQVGLSRSIILK